MRGTMSRLLKTSLAALSLAAMALTLCAAQAGAAPKKIKLGILYTFAGNDSSGASPFAGLIADAAGNFYGTTTAGGGGVGTVFKLAPGGQETVLHTFTDGSDGGIPVAPLVEDAHGNLYGTTYSGGDPQCNCGVVFEVNAAGEESVVHTFKGGDDGATPYDGIILDKHGNLYGTTTAGGGACNCGIAFRLTPKGKLSVLHAFAGGSDGSFPYAGLVMNKQGDLFGASYQGGGSCNCGTIFEIDAAGDESVLYVFGGDGTGDGSYPQASPILDKQGNLYGTTKFGGVDNGGTVFKLAPDNTETILHNFSGGSDGAMVYAGLVADKKGNLYGTTLVGGAANAGTVFKLTPAGAETVLYAFKDAKDGATPYGGLILDKKDNLYGTTSEGGADNYGTVFELH
jgi:uncharacterized repeat protein (TIGR03803 family)